MCGICGYIGVSNDPEATFKLMTHLFDKTEVRGEDASGMWGAIEDKTVLYHKEPVKSSLFVKRPMWAKVGELNPNLLLCHARAASAGVGVPSINKNNHPFLSADGRVGLVHNGRIPDVEYRALKKKFPVVSSCDSELLLRIFEAGDSIPERNKEFESFDASVASRLIGLKDIWSFLSLGHMAVAIGETRDDGVRRLWLFRNKYRSLWLADLRKSLGQVFFFSAPQIWRDATDACEEIKPYLVGGVKLIELPTEEIWLLTISPKLAITNRNALKRFEVCSSGSYSALQENQIATLPSVERNRIELITGLEADDNLIATAAEKEDDDDDHVIGFRTGHNASNVNNRPIANTGNPYTRIDTNTALATVNKPFTESRSMSYPVSPEDIDTDAIDKLCDSVKALVENIKTVFTNEVLSASLTANDFQDLKSQLEQTELDLEGTLRILER